MQRYNVEVVKPKNVNTRFTSTRQVTDKINEWRDLMIVVSITIFLALIIIHFFWSN